jgi:hypothetical protein
MSGNLLQKTLEHYGVAHLRENAPPVQSLKAFINTPTGENWIGAVRAGALKATHAKEYPFLRVPADYGTTQILPSQDHAMAKMLEQVTVDGFFRRKLDVLAHLIDWAQAEKTTRVVERQFARVLHAVVRELDGKTVWPLMVLEAFRAVFCAKTPADYAADDWRYEGLVWLFIVEPVPARYQKGGEREVDVEGVRHRFRMENDDLECLPRDKMAARVMPKDQAAFDAMAGASTVEKPEQTEAQVQANLDAIDRRGLNLYRDASGKLCAETKKAGEK